MTEREMRPMVVRWLKLRNLEIAHEVLLGGYCDLVGFTFCDRTGRGVPALHQVVSVELKTSNVRRAIQQAEWNLPHVNASYVAMPAERCNRMLPATIARFREQGIGLLSVGTSVVECVVSQPWTGNPGIHRHTRKWWRWHRRQPECAKWEELK